MCGSSMCESRRTNNYWKRHRAQGEATYERNAALYTNSLLGYAEHYELWRVLRGSQTKLGEFMDLSNSFGVCRMEVVQAFSDEDSMAGPQIRHASLNVYDKMEECSSLDIL